jgi:uncharacterized protein (TIGR02246 family)
MTSTRTVAFAGLALALAAGIFVASRPARGDQGDAEGVAATCKAFKNAWNAHDAKALAGVFSDDADVTHVDPWGKVDEGKPAILNNLTEMFGPKGPMRDSTIVVHTEVARFPTPDTAVTDADATVNGMYGPDGSKVSMNFSVVNVWKKAGGKWSVFACRPTLKPAPPTAK